MKPSILFILHMPPPVHGAAMMGKYIHDSKMINETFDCHYINLATAKDIKDIGKVGLKKLISFLEMLKSIRKMVKQIKTQLVYVTPNSHGIALYKEFVIVQMLKGMGCKVVIHFHNQGVRTFQDYWPNKWIYPRLFKGVKVILLSEALYEDVRKYVDRQNVLICPNGIPDIN